MTLLDGMVEVATIERSDVPRALTVKVVNRCNLSCTYCYVFELEEFGNYQAFLLRRLFGV